MKQTSLLIALTGLLLLALPSCKTNKEAFNAAYERAKAKQETVTPEAPAAEPAAEEVTEIVEEAAPLREAAETIAIVDNKEVNGRYGVVVGSFINRTNADNLLRQMQQNGYPDAVLGRNAKEMYRVIVAFYPEKIQAQDQVRTLRQKFPDAWVLIKE